MSPNISQNLSIIYSVLVKNKIKISYKQFTQNLFQILCPLKMCGELWSGRGEQEGRMLGEGRGGEFQEGERWGVTRSLISFQAVKTLQLVSLVIPKR